MVESPDDLLKQAKKNKKNARIWKAEDKRQKWIKRFSDKAKKYGNANKQIRAVIMFECLFWLARKLDSVRQGLTDDKLRKILPYDPTFLTSVKEQRDEAQNKFKRNVRTYWADTQLNGRTGCLLALICFLIGIFFAILLLVSSFGECIHYILVQFDSNEIRIELIVLLVVAAQALIVYLITRILGPKVLFALAALVLGADLVLIVFLYLTSFMPKPSQEACFLIPSISTPTSAHSSTLTITPSRIPSPTLSPTYTPTQTPTLTFTPTVTPTLTSTVTSTRTPSPLPTLCVSSIESVDSPTPDKIILDAGTTFVKSWVLNGVNLCSRSTRVFIEGNQMGRLNEQEIGSSSIFTETVTVSVTLIAPADEGQYEGVWRIQDVDGNPIGDEFHVIVVVTPPSPPPPLYPPFTDLNASITQGCHVTFQWQWRDQLAANQYFAIRAAIVENWEDDLGHSRWWGPQDEHQRLGPRYEYQTALEPSGEYVWEIAICQGDPETQDCNELVRHRQSGFLQVGNCDPTRVPPDP